MTSALNMALLNGKKLVISIFYHGSDKFTFMHYDDVVALHVAMVIAAVLMPWILPRALGYWCRYCF